MASAAVVTRYTGTESEACCPRHPTPTQRAVRRGFPSFPKAQHIISSRNTHGAEAENKWLPLLDSREREGELESVDGEMKVTNSSGTSDSEPRPPESRTVTGKRSRVPTSPQTGP